MSRSNRRFSIRKVFSCRIYLHAIHIKPALCRFCEEVLPCSSRCHFAHVIDPNLYTPSSVTSYTKHDLNGSSQQVHSERNGRPTVWKLPCQVLEYHFHEDFSNTAERWRECSLHSFSHATVADCSNSAFPPQRCNAIYRRLARSSHASRFCLTLPQGGLSIEGWSCEAENHTADSSSNDAVPPQAINTVYT